uniref:Uncharacterized protein n=1 Tax=Anopheles dirus TaxID=7168 RepID=A0A182NY28_9DIPT
MEKETNGQVKPLASMISTTVRRAGRRGNRKSTQNVFPRHFSEKIDESHPQTETNTYTYTQYISNTTLDVSNIMQKKRNKPKQPNDKHGNRRTQKAVSVIWELKLF